MGKMIDDKFRDAVHQYVDENSIRSLAVKSDTGYQSLHAYVRHDADITLSTAARIAKVLKLELRKKGQK